VGEYIHGHLASEALEILDVSVHVLVRREPSREAAAECVNDLAVRQPDSVERADSMGKATHNVVRQLAPEGIVPAEFTRPQDGMRLEGVEIGADLVDRPNRAHHVRGHVIASGGPDPPRSRAIDELLDGQLAV
jgi:hypothetical protein